MSTEETISYADVDGHAKSIPLRDMPIIIAKYADQKATEVEAERVAAAAAAAAAASEEED